MVKKCLTPQEFALPTKDLTIVDDSVSIILLTKDLTIVDDPVRIALPTNTDSFKHSIASKLVHDLWKG